MACKNKHFLGSINCKIQFYVAIHNNDYVSSDLLIIMVIRELEP